MQWTNYALGLALVGGIYGLYTTVMPQGYDEDMVVTKASQVLQPGVTRSEAEIRLRESGLVLIERTKYVDTYEVQRSYFSLKAANCCLRITLTVGPGERIDYYKIKR